MQPKLQWPALRKAIHEMQMDNGYSDNAGADKALCKAEAEFPVIKLAFAEQWCASCLPDELAAACAGEECETDHNGAVRCVGMHAEVFVPAWAHEALGFLFDNM